jgi:hypothetical protein
VPRFIVVLKDPPLALCGGSPGLAPTAVAARRAVARGSITTTPPWLLAPA